jgi:hypothetical protein
VPFSRTYPSRHRHIVVFILIQMSRQIGFGFEQVLSHGIQRVGTSFWPHEESDGDGLAEKFFIFYHIPYIKQI